MKIRIVTLLIVSMVLGLIFTGCSNVKEKAESAIAPSNNESVELDESVEAVDEESEDISDLEGVTDRVVTGDCKELGRYKVDEITDEYSDSGVYGLSYTSQAKTEDIVKYFKELLIGTPNYLLKEIPSLGALIKGTINDNRITVAIEYDESGDITFIEFYSYDE